MLSKRLTKLKRMRRNCRARPGGIVLSIINTPRDTLWFWTWCRLKDQQNEKNVKDTKLCGMQNLAEGILFVDLKLSVGFMNICFHSQSFQKFTRYILTTNGKMDNGGWFYKKYPGIEKKSGFCKQRKVRAPLTCSLRALLHLIIIKTLIFTTAFSILRSPP